MEVERAGVQLVLWSLLSHPSIAFPPVYPQQTVQTGLGQLPGNKCWPTLLARRELEDKLPNTGWDQIETEKGDASLEGAEKKGGRGVVSVMEGWFQRELR